MEQKANMQLIKRIEELELQLEETRETIHAIRSGQIDALVVNHDGEPALFTLKSADHAYRIFIEKMAEGAITLSDAGVIIYSNHKFASMINCPLTKVIGATFEEFIAPENKTEFQKIFQAGWSEDIKAEVMLTAGLFNVPVQLSVNPLQMDAGPSLNIIITDLSSQKSTERELKEKNEQLRTLNEALAMSNHDLQQFASVASHDLQEPLRKIQVFSKFLKDKAIDELSESSRQHVDKIISASNRMKTLIVDILTYSRLSADDNNFEPVDMGTLFREIIEDFDLKVAETGARITLGPLPVIEVNKGQLRQVLNNILSNALKFNRAGVVPEITICEKSLNSKETGLFLIDEASYCRISVRDNGIGFDEKFASSIFSLFEKLNPKSSFEGSGIGLAIAKKIIDKHHGMIVAKSMEGQGSEFNIILPLKHPSVHEA